MLAACATSPITLAEKYNLDGELEEASEIYKFRLMSWETIDNQSLIVQTGPNEYYLIVLRRPSPNLVFSESIAISDTGNMVRPGYDRVIVEEAARLEPYVIEKIYKLKDREQANEIKEKLG
jgi:hypothetical protein